MANLTYRQATQEAPVSTTTKNAALTSQEIDGNFKSLNDELITKAPLVSPSLSGVPTAPTAAAGTNTTQLATTARLFVMKRGQSYMIFWQKLNLVQDHFQNHMKKLSPNYQN